MNAEYEAKAIGEQKRHVLFAEAVSNYIRLGGEIRYLTEELIIELGKIPCKDINDTMMLEVAEKLYPGRKPSTINRELYTPVLAVIKNVASQEEWQIRINRPKRHNEKVKLEIPDDNWFAKVLPHLNKNMYALILLLTLHGRRLSEPLNAKPEDVDQVNRTLTIHKTKIGEPILIELCDAVYSAIVAMDNWQSREWLFNLGPKSSSNVRRAIQFACKKAEVRYFTPHQLGRHTFASRLLQAGKSLHHVKDAGHWKTITMVSDRYGHLERQEVNQSVRNVGDDWSEKINQKYLVENENLPIERKVIIFNNQKGSKS